MRTKKLLKTADVAGQIPLSAHARSHILTLTGVDSTADAAGQLAFSTTDRNDIVSLSVGAPKTPWFRQRLWIPGLRAKPLWALATAVLGASLVIAAINIVPSGSDQVPADPASNQSRTGLPALIDDAPVTPDPATDAIATVSGFAAAEGTVEVTLPADNGSGPESIVFRIWTAPGLGTDGGWVDVGQDIRFIKQDDQTYLLEGADFSPFQIRGSTEPSQDVADRLHCHGQYVRDPQTRVSFYNGAKYVHHWCDSDGSTLPLSFETGGRGNFSVDLGVPGAGGSGDFQTTLFWSDNGSLFMLGQIGTDVPAMRQALADFEIAPDGTWAKLPQGYEELDPPALTERGEIIN